MPQFASCRIIAARIIAINPTELALVFSGANEAAKRVCRELRPAVRYRRFQNDHGRLLGNRPELISRIQCYDLVGEDLKNGYHATAWIEPS